MKAILKKEFLLLHPAFYLGYLFAAMIFIPNYPLVIAYFLPLTLSINLVITSINENNDLLFSSLLPLRKKDYVKAKMTMILFFELSYLLLTVPLLFLRNYLYQDSFSQTTPGLNSILSVIGCVFLVYGVYNFVLMTIYFKTAPKRILSYLLSLTTALILFSFFGIVLVYLPIIGPSFNLGGSLLYQYLYFIIGILLFLLFNYFSFRLSTKILEKRDL